MTIDRLKLELVFIEAAKAVLLLSLTLRADVFSECPGAYTGFVMDVLRVAKYLPDGSSEQDAIVAANDFASFLVAGGKSYRPPEWAMGRSE